MAALHSVVSKCHGTGSSGARNFWWQQWDILEEKDPFRRKGSKKDRLEVKDHFKMEKGNKTMRRKGVKARAEVSPENMNSTSSEERSGIVSPYSYKDYGGFKDNSLENMKEIERQIEINKQQSRVESGNLGIPVGIVKMLN